MQVIVAGYNNFELLWRVLGTEGISFNTWYNFHLYDTTQQLMKLAPFSHQWGQCMVQGG
jgi:hypothetical protein